MATGELVKLNYPVRSNLMNGPINKNIDSLLKPLQAAYNAKQNKWAEGLSIVTQYGYELISAGVGFKKANGDNVEIRITFRVRPLPYAFDEAADRGISNAACTAIIADLRKALFHSASSLGGLSKDATEGSSEKMLDFVVNNGRSEPLDTSRFSINLQVHLDGFLEHTNTPPEISCSLDLS